MKRTSTVREKGERVTRFGKHGEVGLAYEMPDGTLYKTSGPWAEETEAEAVKYDGGAAYREKVGRGTSPYLRD